MDENQPNKEQVEVSGTATDETKASQVEENKEGGILADANAQKEEQAKTFTQEQVNELMKRRVERSHKQFFERYGVTNLEELDAKFNQGKGYEEKIVNLESQLADLSQTNAFLKNKVDPSRYEDVKTFFKGSGEQFSEEKLLELAKTHPEWLIQEQKPAFETTITSLSPDRGTKVAETDEEKRKRVFGI